MADPVAAAPKPSRRIDITCSEDEFPAPTLPDTSDLAHQRVAMLAGQQLHQAIRASLDADADAKSKALSLYLAAMDRSIDPALCDGNDCSASSQAQAQVAARAAEQLAALALSAKLPQPYSWALSACALKAADPVLHPTCANVSTQHWAQAAPNNAWPWLLLAMQAQRHNDPSGVDSAMHRASLAGDWWHPGDEARRMYVSHLPPTVSSNTALHALIGVSSLHADKAGLSTLSQYCGADQEANRAQTCARLAAGLLKSANDLYQLSTALKIGARSGVPPDVLASADERRVSAQANMQSTIGLMGDPRRQCPFSQVQARVGIRSAAIGELAAIEEEFRARPR